MHGVMLTTPRLTLRPLTAQDRAPLNRAMNDWNVVSMLAVPEFPHPLEATDAFIEDSARELAAGGALRLAIVRETQVIGVVGVETGRRGPVLGYWLAADAWGRGYMTEAAGAIVDHWLTSRSGDAILSGAFAHNQASLWVQAKLGFAIVGESAVFSRANGRDLPHIDTRLERSRWEALARERRAAAVRSDA